MKIPRKSKGFLRKFLIHYNPVTIFKNSYYPIKLRTKERKGIFSKNPHSHRNICKKKKKKRYNGRVPETFIFYFP